MKSRHFFLPVLLFSTALLVAHMRSGAEMVQGWELGARTGLMWQSGTLHIVGTAGADSLNSERYIADNGWLGGLFAGYNWKEEGVVLGLNLAVDWNEIDDEHSYHAKDSGGDNFLVRARYERDFFYGVSGRVGYQTSEMVMPFVRLGVERSTNRLYLKADNTNNPALPISILETALSHHKTGYLLGVGLEIPVWNKNSHLRLEYQYHYCGRVEFAANNNLISAKAEYQPKAHFLTLGLQWGQV